jgi:hypothetical protein
VPTPTNQTIFTQDGTAASYIAVPGGQRATVTSQGNNLYYQASAEVTSDSCDGEIKDGGNASFDKGQFVITAQGTSTQVIVEHFRV